MSLSQRASAWAYFVIHASSFVEADGRLALVLPGASLHASYAQPLIEYLTEQFGSVRFLRLRERIFAGAEEEVVVLLAAQRGAKASSARVEDVETVTGLSKAISGGGTASMLADIKTGLLPKATRDLIADVLASEKVARLGALATIRIGVVTGANDFFVRSRDELPGVAGTAGVRLVSRSAWLQGPEWTSAELNRRERAGERARLLAVDKGWRRRGLFASELDEAEVEGMHRRHHTAKRGAHWWVLEDLRAPQAFLPYMGSKPRGLALNRTRATCTNTIHRVDFRALPEPHGACASTWTALFDVCAELAGRHYGGGVLKLEPSAAQSLPVITAAIDDEERERATALFSAGLAAEGRAALDRLFLRRTLGLAEADVEALRDAAKRLSEWRGQVRRTPEAAPVGHSR